MTAMPGCPHRDEVIAHAFHQLPPERESALQAHLMACSACRQEHDEIMATVGHLGLAAPETTPPADLRAKVIRRVTETANGTGNRRPMRKARVRVWPAAAAAAVLIIAFGSYAVLRDNGLFSSIQAGRTERRVNLQGVGNAASGRVSFARERSGVRITVEAAGLAPLPPGEVYQLWLIKDGKRTSGGTFVVNADGTGSTSTWLPGDAPFDALGVTHEPDAFGNQPRGPKVMGSTS
jgi:hypothetical protein